MGRFARVAAAAVLAARFVLTAAPARAEPASSLKVGFIGCLAKSDDAELGTQITESLETRLVREHTPGFEFLRDAAAKARAKLKGGPINPQRVADAGRAIGADKIIVCLVTYKRERAATVPGTSKTETVSREVTDYVEEEYYTEVPNPDYEEPVTATLPVGRIGPVGLFVNVGVGDKTPKTIREKHVRRVPRTKTVSEEVTEPADAPTEKPGSVRLRAAYLIIDAASGKTEKRDTVSYLNELEPIFDSMESDQDLRRKAAESTVDSLERSILAKLPSTPAK